MTRLTRRGFLGAGAGLATLSGLGWGRAAEQSADPWAQLPHILVRIKAPVFPARDFEITRYGAVGDGEKDSSEAIQKAIAACVEAGGGRVIIPAGVFLTGPVHLKGNVNLHVASGATLKFVQDPKRYLPAVYSRWEGIECLNYSAFLRSEGQDNVGITGEGTLDGQCDEEHWWLWKRRRESSALLNQMGANDVPLEKRVFGEGQYLRPSFIENIRGKNILIEGVTIINSPMWELHPIFSKNVIVRNVKINSHGPNNDGCDPESCTDVLIENCVFDTGDDCIAIKAGRNRDGRRMGVPTENVVIRGCVMKDGHGGVTIGSEMSGGVRNVFAEDCRMDNPHLNQAMRFKTNAMRGGIIENANFRKITIGQVADAILQIDFYYQEGDRGPERPVVRNIDIRDVTCKKTKYALQLRGFPNAPIRNVHLERCTFDNVAVPDVVQNVEGLVQKDVKVNGKTV